MISMVMPVYNEAKLLPSHLWLASPHIDEIVLVDGSPFGPSTDETAVIASEYPHVKRIEGTFEQIGRKGAWDKQGQLRAGVEAASGDVIIITSADTVYSDYEMLAEALRGGPDGKVWYCPTVEFFIDTQHLRLVMQGEFPHPQIGYTIVSRTVFSKNHTFFDVSKVAPNEMVYLFNLVKYHYGWITDFDVQIQKHIRNVRGGGWGDYGESILAGGEKGLETWAITHVLNYTKDALFTYISLNPHPLKALEFNYLNNFDSVLEKFKEKYGVSYYDCL